MWSKIPNVGVAAVKSFLSQADSNGHKDLEMGGSESSVG
jgi:hypothetical protein